MTKVRAAAQVVAPGEPALWLKEWIQPVFVPGTGTEDHRFLAIGVLRDGREAEYLEDLGVSSQYRGGPFLIPGGVPNGHGVIEPVETVGSLLDLALRQRETPDLRVSMGLEFGNLGDTYREQMEELWKMVHGVSTFGPVFRRERGL